MLQTILYISHNFFFLNQLPEYWFTGGNRGKQVKIYNIALEQYYQISLLNMQEKLHVTTEEKLAWNVDLHNEYSCVKTNNEKKQK